MLRKGPNAREYPYSEAFGYVGTLHVPLDGIDAHVPDGLYDLVVILPVGTAEQAHFSAGDGLNLAGAQAHLVDDLLFRQLCHVGVGVGVVADLHARVGQRLHALRVFVRPLAHQEKCGLHIVLVQDVDQRLGILVTPR